MEQYISFSGLATSPTVLDAPDGQLSHVINLIPEDGTLKPVAVSAEYAFEIGSLSSKLLYTHIGNDYRNHIIFDTDPTPGFLYIEDGDEQHIRHELSHNIPQSFRANAVESIGNILILMGDNTTYHLFWNGSDYDMVGDFSYRINVKSKRMYTLAGGSFGGTGQQQPSGITASLEDHPITINNNTVSDGESREMYNALVAKLNSLIAEYDSKHIIRGTSFGVVALQLYDESYIFISDPFILAPDRADGLERCELTIDTSTNPYTITAITARLSSAKYQVEVYHQLTPSLRKIISGAVVFITKPIETWDVDSPHNILQGGIISYDRLSSDEIYRKFDELLFFRSVSISADDLNRGTPHALENVTGTEESISLADFRRSRYSAKTSYVYNNRLHIAGITEDLSTVGNIKTSYMLPYYQDGQGNFQAWFLGKTNIPFESHSEELAALAMADMKAIVSFGDGRSDFYFEGRTTWPMPPLLTFPDRNATSMMLYIKTDDGHYYESRNTITLHQSTSFDMAYKLFLDSQDREFEFMQDSEWSEVSEDDYDNITEVYNSAHQNDKPARTDNLLRYSEAENPFVFPVNNYVGIGTAAIIGLATSTQPISEGQFGTAPLYVFTEDAVWALSVLDDGTYAPRQPASRDVCINARTITPIDNAVVFATERGIMLISGNTTQCLSEALSGPGEPYAQTPSYQQARAFLALEKEPHNIGGVEQMVDAFTYRDVERPDFRIDFVSDAGIFYDYQNQRLVVFDSSSHGELAYVYSFRSGLWGAAKTDIKSVTHNYPVSMGVYASEYDNRMYAGKAQAATVSTWPCIFACTRPIKLDAPLSFKTIRAAIVHADMFFGNIKTALFASNNLRDWTLVNTSTNHKLRGKLGNPWRYFRIVMTGELEGSDSIDGVHIEYDVRWQNQIR